MSGNHCCLNLYYLKVFSTFCWGKVGQIRAYKDTRSYFPEPVNVIFHGEIILASVVKKFMVRVLRIAWAQIQTALCEKEARRDLKTERRQSDPGAGIGVMWPQARECWLARTRSQEARDGLPQSLVTKW